MGNVSPELISTNNVPRKRRKHYVPMENGSTSSDQFILNSSTFYLITPSEAVFPKSWLFMAEKLCSGIIQLRHALTLKRVQQGPINAIDYLTARFHVFEFAKGHGYITNEDYQFSSTSEWSKVMVVDSLGTVHLNGPLDDVVRFKGSKTGVNRHGALYRLTEAHHALTWPVVVDPICKGGSTSSRKRLVVDPTSDKLYLVVKEHVPSQARFSVYELSEELNKWEKVQTLGLNKVLFAGVDRCFFAQARDFDDDGCLGNCIVFAAGSFPYYSSITDHGNFSTGNDEERIRVYRYGKEDNFSLLSDYPGLSQMLWPPPSWFYSQRNTAQKQTTEKMADHHLQVSWSKLSSQIILTILKHLKTKSDVISFRGVCKRWRKYSVSPPPNSFSCVLPRSIPSFDTCPRLPFHQSTRPPLILQDSSIYLITPWQSQNNERGPYPFVLKPWMVMAEESNSGKISVRHPLTRKRIKDYQYPPSLDLTKFRVTMLAERYSLKHSNSVFKVLMCSSSSSSSLETLVLYGKGILGKLILEKNEDDSDNEEEYCYQWQRLQVRKGGKFWFLYLDDMVSFKGKICGVDRRGKLYLLDHKAMMVQSALVADQLCRGTLATVRRKRLVVDPVSEELHLVFREHVQKKSRFKVYKFNELCNRWDMVETLGCDRMLFVSVDHCFFAQAQHFPGCGNMGNCIIFAANCFTQYCGIDFPDRILFGQEDQDIGVYKLGEEDNFQSILNYPTFSQMIWPPPAWFSPKWECDIESDETEASSSSREASEVSCSSNTSLPDEHEEGLLTDSSKKGRSDDEDDNVEEMQLDSPSQQASNASSSNKTSLSVEDDEGEAQTSSSDHQTHASDPIFTDEIAGHATSKPLSGEPTGKNHCDIEEQPTRTHDHVHEQDIKGENVLNFSPVTPVAVQVVHMPVSPTTCQNCVSTVMFQGVDIRSNLLPTLEVIWSKHGSLVGEDTVRNKDLLACALESLAKMIIILQNSTGRSLTDSQADQLRTVADLERVGLKVNWLVPIVDKALALQRTKPLIESVAALEKAKAEADEREKNFLAENAKVKQELEENRACLSARIPFTEPIDLDECLGKGLFDW